MIGFWHGPVGPPWASSPPKSPVRLDSPPFSPMISPWFDASTKHTILRHSLPPDCPQAYWQACPQTCRPWISCVMCIYIYYTLTYKHTYYIIYIYISVPLSEIKKGKRFQNSSGESSWNGHKLDWSLSFWGWPIQQNQSPLSLSRFEHGNTPATSSSGKDLSNAYPCYMVRQPLNLF